MSRALITCCVVAIAMSLGACGGSSGGNQALPVAEGLLRRATSNELEISLKSGLTTPESNFRSHADELSLSPVSSGNFTGTYTQEVNVDEFDSVRYDGEHLFIAPLNFLSCCWLASSLVNPGPAEPVERAIRILATDPANATVMETGKIPLADDIFVQGMYAVDDQLAALTSNSFFGGYGRFWSEIAIWAPTSSGLRIYDTSDPTTPVETFVGELDGVFVESRRVGNIMYVISRFTPRIDGLTYPVQTEEDQANNQAILDSTPLSEMLPQMSVGDSKIPLVDSDNCYILSDAPDNNGYPIITTITSIPIDDPQSFNSTCYNEAAAGVYVSETAIYVTAINFDDETNASSTTIHKFATAGTSTLYRGSAEVPGQVWRGGQADFRMNEYQGYLRVITTEFNFENEDRFDHRLFVLEESAQGNELVRIAELPNANQPQEIGKANEALYGVRFLGERAYAVTFEQIDPLYVIDLANPVDPKISGELEVTGFSDFLHQVTDDLLLGLGADENGGIKLELFNVADISQPISAGAIVLGGRGSYSEARFDRHAFTYQSDVNGIDRFTVPAILYSEDGNFDFLESGLYFFEINDKNTPSAAMLNAVGRILDNQVNIIASRNRAFIHDDAVFYVQDESVWTSSWFAPEDATGPH